MFQFGDERGNYLVCERLADSKVVLHRRAARQAADGQRGEVGRTQPRARVPHRLCRTWACWASANASVTGVLRKSVCCKILVNNKK